MRMKMEPLYKWIEALENADEETHTYGHLRTPNGCFCALGLYLNECVDGDWHVIGIYCEFHARDGQIYHNDSKDLPEINEDIYDEVTYLNDIGNYTYAQIAKWLRNNIYAV